MQPVATGVPWPVCLSVTAVSPAKMAHPIEVKFEIWTWVGPRNYAFGRCLDPPRKLATLGTSPRPL